MEIDKSLFQEIAKAKQQILCIKRRKKGVKIYLLVISQTGDYPPALLTGFFNGVKAIDLILSGRRYAFVGRGGIILVILDKKGNFLYKRPNLPFSQTKEDFFLQSELLFGKKITRQNVNRW